MIQRRLAVDEQLAEDRQQAAVEAHFTAKRQRYSGSAGQTVGRQRAQQPAAVGNAQRALGGGSAPLAPAARAQLEDLVGQASPCQRFRRAGATHTSSRSLFSQRTTIRAHTHTVPVHSVWSASQPMTRWTAGAPPSICAPSGARGLWADPLSPTPQRMSSMTVGSRARATANY